MSLLWLSLGAGQRASSPLPRPRPAAQAPPCCSALRGSPRQSRDAPRVPRAAAGWLARELPSPVPGNLGQASPGRLSWVLPHGPQGPGAKEARRAGSPLPRGAARPPVCVPLPCRPWPEPRHQGRALPTSVFLLACPLLWSLRGWAGARAASTTASCAHRVPGSCGGPEEAALAGMRTVTPASLHPLFLVSPVCFSLGPLPAPPARPAPSCQACLVGPG